MSVQFTGADKLGTRLRAARIDNSLEAEMRRIAAVDTLIVDGFAIKPLDGAETNDYYEIVVERHRRKSTIITSNRDPPNGWPWPPTPSWLNQPSTGSPKAPRSGK